jgi:hypothetical protein
VQEFLATLIKEQVSLPLALCLAVAFVVTKVVSGRWQTALKTSGSDREELTNTLELGGDLRRHYVRLITTALDQVDRFLGDVDKAEDSIPSPFGNRRKAPYWTAWSFDKCALIAVAYPIVGLFLTWVLTGEAGEVGAILHMAPNAHPVRRLLAGLSIGCIVFAFVKGAGSDRWRFVAWYAAGFAVAFAVAETGDGAFASAGAFTVAFAVAFSGAGTIAGTVACAVAGAGAVVGTFAGAVDGVAAVGDAVRDVVTVAVAVAIIWLTEQATKRRRLGTFWLIFWPIAVLVCYAVFRVEASLRMSPTAPVLLVMIGLVPLMNVPLDWASVGFTRALLRRGCEDDAPSPL